MNILLIYDISHDGTRTKVADLCLDYGLDRIQYSAFLGQLSRTRQEELMLQIQKKLGKRPGDIRLIPVCAKDWAAQLLIQQARQGTPSPPTPLPEGEGSPVPSPPGRGLG
jgi:CRISPR-associated protein Cas2